MIALVCKKCDGGKRLGERLAELDDVTVRMVGCQKVCSHHVVGIRRPGHRVVWLEKIDSKQRRRALRTFVESTGDRAPKRLRRLVVAKRSGLLR